MKLASHDLGNKIYSFAKCLAKLRAIFRRPAYLSISLILILAGLQIMSPPFWQDLLLKVFGIISGNEEASNLSIILGFLIVISGVFVFSLGLLSEKVINKSSNVKYETQHPFIYSNLPSVSHKLYGRGKYIIQLDSAWADNRINIVVLNAIGGIGKTSLVSTWANQLNFGKKQNSIRILAWSFYRSGQIAAEESPIDQFFNFAYKIFVHQQYVKEIYYDEISLLCESIRKEKTLLILDGIEVLQFPPGHKVGRFKDDRLRVFLQNLAIHNNGLCILTTRIKPSDLDNFFNSTVKVIDLEKLSDHEGAQFLKQLGVKGDIDDLKNAISDFGGHPLALKLLGGYIVSSKRGDIVQQSSIERFVYEEEPDGKHAWWVVNSYEQWFQESPKGRRELNILYLLSAINRPVTINILKKICSSVSSEDSMNNITEDLNGIHSSQWYLAVKDLQNFGLLLLNGPENNLLSCHPIVTSFFIERLEEQKPKTLAEIRNKFNEIFYGDQLDKFEKTFKCSSKDIYNELISQIEHLFNIKLSSSGFLVDDIIDYIPHAIRTAETLILSNRGSDYIDTYTNFISKAIKDGCNIRLNKKPDIDIYLEKYSKQSKISLNNSIVALEYLPAHIFNRVNSRWYGFINFHPKNMSVFSDIIYVPISFLSDLTSWFKIYPLIAKAMIDRSKIFIATDLPLLKDMLKNREDTKSFFDLLIEIAKEIIGYDLGFCQNCALYNKIYWNLYSKYNSNNNSISFEWAVLLSTLVNIYSCLSIENIGENNKSSLHQNIIRDLFTEKLIDIYDVLGRQEVKETIDINSFTKKYENTVFDLMPFVLHLYSSVINFEKKYQADLRSKYIWVEDVRTQEISKKLIIGEECDLETPYPEALLCMIANDKDYTENKKTNITKGVVDYFSSIVRKKLLEDREIIK